jgi:hypothetical protein
MALLYPGAAAHLALFVVTALLRLGIRIRWSERSRLR